MQNQRGVLHEERACPIGRIPWSASSAGCPRRADVPRTPHGGTSIPKAIGCDYSRPSVRKSSATHDGDRLSLKATHPSAHSGPAKLSSIDIRS